MSGAVGNLSATGDQQTTLGRALLQAVDAAFLQTLGSRFGGGVEAAEVTADGLAPRQVLRPAPVDNPARLLLAYTRQDAPGAAGSVISRIPGLAIGGIALPAGEPPQIIVLTELFDTSEPNAHADGEPLTGGVRLHPAAGSGGVQVVRTREQAASIAVGGFSQSRGMVPPQGRHRPRAGLGLGGGSHRQALIAATRTAVAGRLLDRLGSLLAGAEAAGPLLAGITLGLSGA